MTKQTTTTTTEPTNPLSVLDFVKEQLASQEPAKVAEAHKEPFPATTTKAPASDAATTAKETTKEATTTTEPSEVEVSPLVKSILGEKTTDASKAGDTKPDVDPDKITLPDSVSLPAKEAFKKVNADRAKLKDEVAKIKSELEELRLASSEGKVTELQTELDSLKAEREEAERKLFALDVKQSKQWSDMIDKPLADYGSKLDEVLSAYDEYSDESVKRNIRKAIASGDKAELSKYLSTLNEYDKLEVVKIREGVQGVLKTRNALEQDAKAAKEIMTKADQTRMELEQRAYMGTYKSAVAGAKESVEKLLPFVFQERDGDENHNKMLSNYKSFVEASNPAEFTPDVQAQVVALAAAAPLLGATIEALVAGL